MGQSYYREKYFLCLKKYFFAEKYFLTGCQENSSVGCLFGNPKTAYGGGGQKRPRADLEMVRGGAPATYSKTYPENTQFKP